MSTLRLDGAPPYMPGDRVTMNVLPAHSGTLIEKCAHPCDEHGVPIWSVRFDKGVPWDLCETAFLKEPKR